MGPKRCYKREPKSEKPDPNAHGYPHAQTYCYISIIYAFKFLFDAHEFEISLPYVSKTVTGFVGFINNQCGEKAYASALIQMMFYIPRF